MVLAHLSRPSILCQCSRCSSSVAACENEWATLSDTYSTVTGWLSIDRNRINVLAENKQIPQSSELKFVRGRVVQDIVCRLCHQKLGGLVHLEPGAKVFWKLSKMSFREIISMKESQPIFVESSISWFLDPAEQTVAETEAKSSPSLFAIRAESALNQTLSNQGANLNRLLSSVEELHDTMTDLKQSFKTSLLELKTTTPTTRSQNQNHNSDEPPMEMLKTMLKELQSKSDEIEKLRLENESLKLKARYMQGQQVNGTSKMLRHPNDHHMPEVQSPGFLNERGRRGFSGARTQIEIADSFDEDNDMLENITNNETHSSIPPVKIPLKPAADTRLSSQELAQYDEPASKRLRLSLTENREEGSNTNVASQPHGERKRGRPFGSRRSHQRIESAELTPSAIHTPLSANVTMSPETQTRESPSSVVDAVSNSGSKRPRGRPRRARSKVSASRSASLAASRAPSAPPAVTPGRPRKHEEASEPHQNPTLQNEIPKLSTDFNVSVNVAELSPESAVNGNELSVQKNNQDTESHPEGDHLQQRQAKIAARDVIAKAAMEREEAMADE